MLFLMKLLFGFCLDIFLCQNFWITQASNLEVTKKKLWQHCWSEIMRGLNMKLIVVIGTC